MNGKKFFVVLALIFIILLIITINTDLFTGWTFFGLLFMGLIYLFGYLYVVNYYNNLMQREEEEKANKKKFDWCWNRVNEILRKMPGGQGLEWRKGVGRRSELRTYHDGISHKPFRSLMGYLAERQQLVIIIYDIDNDDIVKFHADPDAEVIENHFHGFKPFQTRSMLQNDYHRRRPNSRYSGYKRGRGVNIHVGGDDYEDFDSMQSTSKVEEDVADDALKKIKNN